MSTINKQLIGSNFCGLGCAENNNTIHPETCVNNVVVSDDSTVTLNEWFGAGSFTNYGNLLGWLQNNYPMTSGGYVLPKASATTLGGVKIDTTYLIINSDGKLSINTNNLPSATIRTATISTTGAIKLGNETLIHPSMTGHSDAIPAQSVKPYSYQSGGEVYVFPIRLDANNRAGITIPTKLFETTADLTNYYTKSQVDTLISNYYDKPTVDDKINAISTTGNIGTGKLNITRNNTHIGTFGANDTDDTTINIVVPTNTSDLTNDLDYVISSNLSTVATSGSYEDLSNKPTIPTIPNITITTSGTGNLVSSITANDHTLTVFKTSLKNNTIYTTFSDSTSSADVDLIVQRINELLIIGTTPIIYITFTQTNNVSLATNSLYVLLDKLNNLNLMNKKIEINVVVTSAISRVLVPGGYSFRRNSILTIINSTNNVGYANVASGLPNINFQANSNTRLELIYLQNVNPLILITTYEA